MMQTKILKLSAFKAEKFLRDFLKRESPIPNNIRLIIDFVPSRIDNILIVIFR